MAVTAPFNSALASRVEAPPRQWTGVIPAGTTVSVGFLNVAELVRVTSTKAIHVAYAAAGYGSGCSTPIAADGEATLVGQCKRVWITVPGSADATVSVHATLSTLQAAEIPDLTEANGFDGIESHAAGTIVYEAPAFTSVSPDEGDGDGPVEITVVGTGFRAGVQVIVGGVACVDEVLTGSVQIVCKVPISTDYGLKALQVVNVDGLSVTQADAYEVTEPAGP